jgi:hypothetical protein
MIVVFVLFLGILLVPLYFWEKKRDKNYNRFEEAAAREQKKLSSRSRDELLRQLHEHEYLRSLADGAGCGVVDEILQEEPQAVLDQWERVSRELVAAERAKGRGGTPGLMKHEAELLALLRSLR